MRTFTYSDAKSHKFWNIEVQGDSYTVTYGKIGTDGQTKTKSFPSAEKAQAEVDKLIKEKLKKGYTETTAGTTVKSDREVLEDAILANPDDRGAHSAYADLLMEQGDPRGDFIRVQLALEDESLSAKDRANLKKQEEKLLKDHQSEWLGELAPTLLEEIPKNDYRHDQPQYQSYPIWVHGSLMGFYIADLNVARARAIVKSADQLKLIRELRLGETAYEETGEYEPGPDIPEDVDDYIPVSLYPLARWAQLPKIRIFQLGMFEEEDYTDYCPFNCHTDGEQAYHLIKQMPEIEELYLLAHQPDLNKIFALDMPKLRILQVYHASDYPVDKLAKNQSLQNVTHLLFHPHVPDYDEGFPYELRDLRAILRAKNLPNLTHLRLRMGGFGNQGCEEIVKSGILKRLKVLDLRHGMITDEGAKALAACEDLKNLELLDVSRNGMTDEGINALKATGITVQTSHQGNPDEEYLEHVFQGDIE